MCTFVTQPRQPCFVAVVQAAQRLVSGWLLTVLCLLCLFSMRWAAASPVLFYMSASTLSQTDPGGSPQAAGGVGTNPRGKQETCGGGTSSSSGGGCSRAAAAAVDGRAGGGGISGWWRGWAGHERRQPAAAAAVCAVGGWHDPGGVMCERFCWQSAAIDGAEDQMGCRTQSNNLETSGLRAKTTSWGQQSP
jgi:hypothetical protein